MRYWSNNPELYDEITTQCLPKYWRDRIESEETDLEGVPEDIRYGAAVEAEKDYSGTLIDEAVMRWKEEKLSEGG